MSKLFLTPITHLPSTECKNKNKRNEEFFYEVLFNLTVINYDDIITVKHGRTSL